MATNKFKPFATSPDANVMTDEQLASAEELSTGFKLKSKADSKLIGKLIQDTSAAAYAIGEFVVNNGGANDVTGTNPTQLAQDFDTAVKSVVSGSTGTFVTESDLTEKLEPINTTLQQKADASALESKADKTELTTLAPLANPQFTGNVTINGTNVATVDDLAEIEVDLSNYTGDVSLTQGDNAIKMTSTGVSIKSAGFNGGAETSFDKVALKSEIPTDYLATTGGTITGDLTVTGTISATIEGTTENAVKLATARNITLTGAVTGTSTTGFDGSADLAINTTAVNGTMVTGVVPEATKATQDGDGNVISTTYAKVSQLTSVMTYKGTVASESALPKSDQTIGDVYNVTDTNMNYAWDGSKWDQLGSSVDLSGYLTTSAAGTTYATKTELSDGLATKAASTHTHTTAQVDGLDATLAGKQDVGDYALNSDLENYVPKAGDIDAVTYNQKNYTVSGSSYTITKDSPDVLYLELTGDFTFTCSGAVDTNRTIKVQIHKAAAVSGTATVTWNGVTEWLTDGNSAPVFGQVASTEHNLVVAICLSNTVVLGNTLYNSENPVTGGTVTIDGVSGLQDALDGKQAAGDYALNSALSAYAPLASPALTGTPTVNGVGIADDNDVAAKINLTGSRGQLAGYETVSDVGAVTINRDSADSIEAVGNVTVSNGSTGQCWTKVVHIIASTPNVQLGSAWHWQNGSNPEMKTGGFLVLCWCSTAGLAIYNNVG